MRKNNDGQASELLREVANTQSKIEKLMSEMRSSRSSLVDDKPSDKIPHTMGTVLDEESSNDIEHSMGTATTRNDEAKINNESAIFGEFITN